MILTSSLVTGKIEAIIISGNGKILGFFGKDEEIIIPWKNIMKIGEDVILVRYKETNELRIVMKKSIVCYFTGKDSWKCDKIIKYRNRKR